MEFKDFLTKFNIPMAEAVEFMNNNDWFGSKPEIINGSIVLTEEQQTLFAEKLNLYVNDGNSEVLLKIFKDKFPSTFKILKRFFREASVPEEARFYLTDFLLANLKKDLVLYSNDEIEELLNIAADDLIHIHAELLTFFFAFTRSKYKTRYSKNYGMASKKLENNGAYTFDEYIEILYYLFNEDYISSNDMYAKAARSKNYADTWLFLALHFVCSLRMTDLERIYHPELPKPPEQVLEEIENGTFSDLEAREVLLSITRKLCVLPLKPNKTKGTSDVSDIKFVIPHSCEVHIGKLFALVEAHQQVSGKTGPIVRKVTDFKAITRNMGEDIGILFLQCNFRCRKANKSFLQAIENLAGDVLGEEGVKVKGYMLAALARSHKAGYGKFASTIATYLRDEAFSGFTPEFVAFELFERGILSFIPSMMLDIITGRKYKELDVQNQTSIVKAFDLNPKSTEGVVSVMNLSRKQAQKTLEESLTGEVPILEILHNIGSGSAFSKQPECLCLLAAIYKKCPYDNINCIGCKYEISTKSTLCHMGEEYYRAAKLYQSTKNNFEQNKYQTLIVNLIIPKMEEMLYELKNNYGEEVYNDYLNLVKNYVE